MRLKIAILALLSVVAAPLAARADTVDFTMTMTASGYVNGVAYNDQPFTIAATYDTADVRVNPMGVHVIFTTFYYTIPSLAAQPLVGVGPYQYIACYSVACGTGTGDNGDLLDSANPAGFDNYDLVTPIPPVIGSGHSLPANHKHHAGFDALTDAGMLELDQTSLVLTTFIFHSATTPPGSPVDPPATTPEPSSLLLLSTGILGVAGALRRRVFRA
jgi:PEP-CTERM motif